MEEEMKPSEGGRTTRGDDGNGSVDVDDGEHMITIEDIHAAARRICRWVHKTPLLTSKALDAMAGRQLYFKAENLQKTGSFKARGACNAVCVSLSFSFD